jgi:predicted HAD superfamily Cof-like phosphohydrolase
MIASPTTSKSGWLTNLAPLFLSRIMSKNSSLKNTSTAKKVSPMPDILHNTLEWFQEARPEPSGKDFTTQLGVHIEEFGEMLEELTAQSAEGSDLLVQTLSSVQRLANFIKTNDNSVVVTTDCRVDFLDSLCDQIVTATGVAHCQSMDILGGMEEVNSSNFSKFVDGKPYFDSNKKVIKGPDYVKADLTNFA